MYIYIIESNKVSIIIIIIIIIYKPQFWMDFLNFAIWHKSAIFLHMTL
jgi:hypothetical protein